MNVHVKMTMEEYNNFIEGKKENNRELLDRLVALDKRLTNYIECIDEINKLYINAIYSNDNLTNPIQNVLIKYNLIEVVK